MALPVDEGLVEQAEIELGVTFPESFRNKMIKNNGGGVEASNYYFELHPFYDPLDKKRTSINIVYATEISQKHSGLPNNLIVIGNDGEGDLLVYKSNIHGEIEPPVYRLDNETNELILVANDFKQLNEIQDQRFTIKRNQVPSLMLGLSILITLFISLSYLMTKLGVFSTSGLGASIALGFLLTLAWYSSLAIAFVSLILAVIFKFTKENGSIILLYAFFIAITPLAFAIISEI